MKTVDIFPLAAFLLLGMSTAMKRYVNQNLRVLSNDGGFETKHSCLSSTQCALVCHRGLETNFYRFSATADDEGIWGDCWVSSRTFSAPMSAREVAAANASTYYSAYVLHAALARGNQMSLMNYHRGMREK